MRLLIHIVTAKRVDYLKSCLASVLSALPDNTARVSIVVNGEDRETTEWLSSFTHPALCWFSVPAEPRTVARNRAFDDESIDIIHFLDDDVVVPLSLFRDALHCFESETEIAIVGGPNLTPVDSTETEKIFGAVMTSAFASPMVRVRYGAGAGREPKFPSSERDLILCNLAVRRSAIPEGLRFKKHLRSNEENLFLYRCRQIGLVAFYSPELFVYHHRRSTLGGFIAQLYSYGFGRSQQTIHALSSCHIGFLIPPAAVAVFLVLLAMGKIGALVSLVGLHILLSLAGSIASPSVRERGIAAVFAVVPLTLAVHAAYGLGFWKGLGDTLRFQMRRRSRAIGRAVPRFSSAK